ncbi:uncharacterized protein LOC141666025 [Apium graveolens]|uniref:uncharacterized protein LOC141666025 n=1 Tax=Apium graveolens TaxID=4045 RepID=UPI003D7BBACE
MANESPNNREIMPLNQDISSIYCIHPSDASTTQLVSTKFSGVGFHNWKCSMMLSLSAKNKLGFVNGTIPEPDITSTDHKLWAGCNDLIISWLLFNLDETIAKSVLFMRTAQEIWDDLEGRYGYASMAHNFYLEQQLLDINQGSDSVSEIKQQQEDQILLQFMMKLNENFTTVYGNILMMHPLPNLSQAYRVFIQEERHKEMSQLTNQTETMAFYADRKRFNTQRNFNTKPNATEFPGMNNVGNYIGNTVPNSFNRKGAKPYYCNHDKIPGHSMERCFKLHGYPPGFQAKNDTRKFAALSQHTLEGNGNDPEGNVSNSDNCPTVPLEQYNQLKELYNK